MSLEILRSVFDNLPNCRNWSLQLLRIVVNRNETNYASRQIALHPDDALNNFVADLAARYADRETGVLSTYTSVESYDGSAIGTVVYKVPTDTMIAEEYAKFISAIAEPENEANPLNFTPQAYLLKGRLTIDNEPVRVKLISMQKPVTTLRHKYFEDNGTFKAISNKVLSLRPAVDVAIVEDTVYFLTMAGENLFNMERSYRAICSERVDSVCQTDIVFDLDCFRKVARSGHNPRKFLAFNENRLSALRNRNRRLAMARKFAIPLRDDKFDTSDAAATEKLVKLLCNKGMVDPFEDLAVEVAGSKRWE